MVRHRRFGMVKIFNEERRMVRKVQMVIKYEDV
jgi:hypothetical protein